MTTVGMLTMLNLVEINYEQIKNYNLPLCQTSAPPESHYTLLRHLLLLLFHHLHHWYPLL